jgi:hypothetical protein
MTIEKIALLTIKDCTCIFNCKGLWNVLSYHERNNNQTNILIQMLLTMS